VARVTVRRRSRGVTRRAPLARLTGWRRSWGVTRRAPIQTKQRRRRGSPSLSQRGALPSGLRSDGAQRLSDEGRRQVRRPGGEGREYCERRPSLGAPSPLARQPGYQACTYLCQPGQPARSCDGPDLPRHASRGWSRVGTWLPCPDVPRVRSTFVRRKDAARKPTDVIDS